MPARDWLDWTDCMGCCCCRWKTRFYKQNFFPYTFLLPPLSVRSEHSKYMLVETLEKCLLLCAHYVDFCFSLLLFLKAALSGSENYDNSRSVLCDIFFYTVVKLAPAIDRVKYPLNFLLLFFSRNLIHSSPFKSYGEEVGDFELLRPSVRPSTAGWFHFITGNILSFFFFFP